MNKKQLFLGDLAGLSDAQVRSDIAERFDISRATLAPLTFLIAAIFDDSYESSAWFLVRQEPTGQLCEVHASHCSCYGYEGQWELESTTLEYLKSEKFSFRGYVVEPAQQAIKNYIASL